jgi:hypothetical protein
MRKLEGRIQFKGELNIEQGISNDEVFYLFFNHANNLIGQIYSVLLKIKCSSVLRHSLFLVRYSAVHRPTCRGMRKFLYGVYNEFGSEG